MVSIRAVSAALVSLAIASTTARAQTIPVPPVGGAGQSQSVFFDDGGAETFWKVSSPTGPGDAFNVDFDSIAAGMTITGVALSTFQTNSAGTFGLKYVLIAPDHPLDSTGHTPDLNNPLSILGSLNGTVTITGTPNAAAGFCSGFVGYDLPDVTAPSGGLHAVTTFLTGDSMTWLCADSSASDDRSYFTSTNYSTPATLLAANDLMVRVIGTVNTGVGSAYLTVNNGSGSIELDQAGLLSATLWSNCAIQPTLFITGVSIPGYPFLQFPSTVLSTGFENGSPIADPTQGTISGFLSNSTSCACVPAGTLFDVSGFYLDHCSLKSNGKPRLRATNAVRVLVTPNLLACNPCVCFGQVDDGSLDTNLWKTKNPTGSRDYFNVKIGGAIDACGSGCGITAVTAIEMASWDFCGSGPSWASVGLYEESTLDPKSPDLAAAVALATTLAMAPGAAETSYPATVYDFPDVLASTSAALANLTSGHIAARWKTNDTCIWMASDTDGTDDDANPTGGCSVLPSTSSYFTQNGYSTPSTQLPTANWMMKLDWN